MGLELLSQADMVLNACGRPVPPPGFKFVDLPRIIPFHHTPQGSSSADHFVYGAELGVVYFTSLIPGVQFSLTIVSFPPVPVPTAVTVIGNNITLSVATSATVADIISFWASNPVHNLVSLVNGTYSAANLLVAPFYNNPPAVTNQLLPIASTTFTEGWPTQDYFENTSNTLFIVMGIMLKTDPVSIRIKWPNGRYWNQTPSGNQLSAGASFPQGTGGNLYALDEFVMIERGGKVAVEMSGPNVGNVDVHLWGKLRYLLKDTGGLATVDGKTCIIGYPDAAKPQGAPNCLVGYPVKAGATLSGGAIKMIQDPIEVLKFRKRFECWPNGNIFAPEFRMGNQCETNTPPGYEDESFTFFSGVTGTNIQTPYVIPGGGQNYSNPIAVPGQDDVVIRRFRAIVTWSGGATGIPVVQLRLPNGYSVTGGDQIPINLGYWIPVFPTLRVAAGTVLIVDLADSIQESSAGSINVILEFDAVKRRKIAA